MNVHVPAYLRELRYHLNDPLYKNSVFIFTTRLLTVVVGFVFWMIAARLYSVEDVGLAVALISSATLINLFSTLGIEHSIIRFFPAYSMARVINSSIIIVTLTSLAIGVAYSIALILLSSDLAFVSNPVYLIIFVAFGVISTIAVVTGNIFIAMRKTLYYLVQNVFISFRVLFLIPLIFLGSFGIVGSTMAAYIVAFLFVLFILSRFIRFDFRADRDYIRNSFSYSSRNYVATLLSEVPFLLMPVIVLHVLGEADAARYYIAFTIGSFLMQITYTISTSLFVEGSHGESMKKNVIKSGIAIYSLLVPAFLCICLFGEYVLNIYGSEYVAALDLLKLVALSSFFQAIYSLYCAIQKVNMGMDSVIKLNLIMFCLFLGLSYALMGLFGTTGVGYAMVVTFIVIDLLIIGICKKEKWI
ncbi:lipopolysaccharide biosynthesis protein [Methanocella arvoryzae]|uniref:Oligosaccharide repeat unit transporter n=1 Tax=Methanocella arvoryzae (strain DSM 22066 / NBRC 105507 / MRE50) TaxID=351160 RepID=Q0W3C5_METAR|nr:lipopolysaccharide biosynthesis protein [Methanocella arvoryzae]CAJ37118.1 putative oligosaccharide repeat unit transporter [Methanocella arvoryzae MRE50]